MLTTGGSLMGTRWGIVCWGQSQDGFGEGDCGDAGFVGEVMICGQEGEI